jgi:exodeoxyribonuclease VII large subunit
VPVVSAVGHEVDVTVADLVADVRAATPTHAAELVVPVSDDLSASLAALRGRMVRAEGNAVEQRRRVLRALRAELSDPRRILSDQRRRLDDLVHRGQGSVSAQLRAGRARVASSAEALRRREPRALLRELRRRRDAALEQLRAWSAATFRRESMRLASLGARLEPANVARILSSGFALALADGRPLRRSADAAPGAPLRVVLGTGWLDARVESTDAPPDPIPGRSTSPDEA